MICFLCAVCGQLAKVFTEDEAFQNGYRCWRCPRIPDGDHNQATTVEPHERKQPHITTTTEEQA